MSNMSNIRARMINKTIKIKALRAKRKAEFLDLLFNHLRNIKGELVYDKWKN